MSAHRKLPRIIVRPAAILLAALLILLDGSAMALLPLIAACCHEAGHLAAMLACGIPVREIEITPFGADIRGMQPGNRSMRAAAVYASGPLANLLCAAASMLFCASALRDFFAVSSLALAVLNLLPIRTLDGGNALLCLLGRITPAYAESIAGAMSAAALFLLWLTAGWLLLLCGGNVSLLLFCMYIFAELYLK